MERIHAGNSVGDRGTPRLSLNMQTLWALVQASPLGIIAVDYDGRLRMWNPAAERIFGWQKNEVLGRLIPAASLEDWDAYETIRKRALAGESFSGVGMTSRTREGLQVQISLSTAPVLDHQGRIIGTMAVISDVTERKKMEEALSRSLEKTERLTDDTINVLASAIEKRDPYTAGHQQRVGRLAVALAARMRYPVERLRAVRLAAIIHDIGKLYVPAEILCKPSRLSEIELRLLESHAIAGYEILKGIDFPWPIADIVRQHHERLDGSGYPAGLLRDEILPEARIVGVADVVEAISSHRPYRPALGDEAAVREIRNGIGTRYDPEVAEALFSLLDADGRLPAAGT
jgi:PAS domain S-box-containing protein/putative nucleotidyltransferase with HDIG domain